MRKYINIIENNVIRPDRFKIGSGDNSGGLPPSILDMTAPQAFVFLGSNPDINKTCEDIARECEKYFNTIPSAKCLKNDFQPETNPHIGPSRWLSIEIPFRNSPPGFEMVLHVDLFVNERNHCSVDLTVYMAKDERTGYLIYCQINKWENEDFYQTWAKKKTEKPNDLGVLLKSLDSDEPYTVDDLYNTLGGKPEYKSLRKVIGASADIMRSKPMGTEYSKRDPQFIQYLNQNSALLRKLIWR